MNDLEKSIKNLPDKPGAYLFKDDRGQVIYVGKAKSLKKRVSSYFQTSNKIDPKVQALREKISDIDFFITSNEVDALILECNLIKEYRPRFNVSYRDDKSYPYIAITVSDDFPRIYVSREKHQRGKIYFGPYTRPVDVRETLDSVRKIFPLRDCRGKVPGRNRNKPCLNYHINLCLGPCDKQVNKSEYRKMVNQVIRFLEGGEKEVINLLETEMKRASSDLEFEKAARLRDRILAAKSVIGLRQYKHKTQKDLDIIASSGQDSKTLITVLRVRDNKLIGSENFLLKSGQDSQADIYLSSFIKQYYSSFNVFPKEIAVEKRIEDQELIQEWLSQKRKSRVNVSVPTRGYKRRLVELARDNASQALTYQLLSSEKKDMDKILMKLQKELCLSHLPRRIEAFDISNISGRHAVGSMIVFNNNLPEKRFYRRFKIKLETGPNDYEMMKELISRRLKYLSSQESDNEFQIVPDLILIDGGKPQLTAALEAAKMVGVTEISFIALAKKEEEIYHPQLKQPIILDKKSESLKLIQRIRDEAHRFALQYHRELRSKRMTSSMLDQIEGIGPKRKASLIKEFGSVERLAKASLQELDRTPGISSSLARTIYKTLHR